MQKGKVMEKLELDKICRLGDLGINGDNIKMNLK
jgi:hypothetical protein